MIDNLTIIIPFFNGHEYIDRLLSSLPTEVSVIIIDDKSDISLSSDISKYKKKSIQIINSESRLYFSGAVNLGIEACDTDVLVLNQDTWFEDTSWQTVIADNRDRYDLIGERIRDNHPSFGGLGYVHGTFMYMSRRAIDVVGLLNDRDYPLWGGTAEWQWRVARHGFEVLPLKKIPGFYHERNNGESYGSSIKTLLQKEPEKRSLLIRTPPLLSVVVLCYNYAKYLPDCINSLLGGPTSLGQMKPQTLQSFEIVIVDDASTDNTSEIASEIAKIEKGIRYYRLEKNVGTAQALNYGIQRSYGKYITFLSADDMRESDSLENLVRVCEQNPHSFAYDDIWLVYKHQRVKKWEMEEYDFDKLLYQNQVHAGIVFPKAAWVEVGGYPAIMNDGREDWAFNIALGIHGYCGIHLRQFGYLYRREGQNRTERNTSEYFREYFLDKIKRVFPKIYGGLRPMACCGKGSNNRTNNAAKVSTLSLGGNLMAESVGSQGMEKIEYLGKQMSSTWQGEVTNANYTFGVDGRVRGWVDRRDLGSREEKKGFLAKKDRQTGEYLFRVFKSTKAVAKEPEPEPEKEVISEPQGAVAVSQVSGVLSVGERKEAITISEKKNLFFPDPTDLNVEEIKRLDLSLEQWQGVYRTELANRNRKGAIAYIEELIANWSK